MDAQDKDGQSPLYWAAVCGHAEVVRLLVDKGSIVDEGHEKVRSEALDVACAWHTKEKNTDMLKRYAEVVSILQNQQQKFVFIR